MLSRGECPLPLGPMPFPRQALSSTSTTAGTSGSIGQICLNRLDQPSSPRTPIPGIMTRILRKFFCPAVVHAVSDQKAVLATSWSGACTSR